MSVAEIPDPRAWPAAGPTGTIAKLHRTVAAAIESATRRDADLLDAEARRVLAEWITTKGSADLAAAFAYVPSPVVARHLRRLLAALERGEPGRSTELRTTLVALPVVLVAALDAREGDVALSGVLPDTGALEALLRDAQEFGGAQTFALAPTLVGAEAIDVAALPTLLARGAFDDAQGRVLLPPLDFAPAPLRLLAGSERVHLRFIVGAVLTAPRTDPLHATAIARWGMTFAQAVSRQLGAPGLSLLALPRPPERLVPALQTGRAAQREVSARLFASNAIRKFRASVGEPTAIISAHRAADAPGGGELRLSLSSPFALREAEGFRCPLEPYESAQDAAKMLTGVLEDCRILDVRIRAGVHADIDPVTGAPLLFKNAGAGSAQPLH